MINNRQGGRRRGRGGQRPQNLSGRPDGNRQDNRQRGNAAQLLEKYKSMARDAQLGGDRVQTEYYLQYAEHYYRVLGESRARFEEQRRARGEDMDDDETDDDMSDGGDDQDSQDQQVRADNRPQRNDRNERYDRNEGSDRSERNDRPDGNRSEGGERYQRAERTQRPRYVRNDGDGADREASDNAVAEEAPRAPRAPRNASRREVERPVESISFDALPPAIGASAPVAEADDEPAPPKRRARKPRVADDEGDIAPAA